MKNILIITFASILPFSSFTYNIYSKTTMPLAEPTNTEKLCGKNFIITDEVERTNETVTSTGLSAYNACDLDDIERYEINGTYTFDERAVKCDPI